MTNIDSSQLVVVDSRKQKILCYLDNVLHVTYSCSTAKNGLGELNGSWCTPRGWHIIHNKIGMDAAINSVFVGRQWTGKVYSPELAQKLPESDWILTRIIQIDGMEPGRNHGGDVDSLTRYIYFHGTPDENKMAIPQSKGCIRMKNQDIIKFADWVDIGSLVYIR